jgi:hypothetical protein
MLVVKQRLQSSLKKFLLLTSINDTGILYTYIQKLNEKYCTTKYIEDLAIINKILTRLLWFKNNEYEMENNFIVVNEIISNVNIIDMENKNIIVNMTNYFVNAIYLLV